MTWNGSVSTPADRPGFVPEGDDSDLAASFAVGPSGVGPVMGFGTDDFFPVVPAADSETGPRSVDPFDGGETGQSPLADRAAAVAASSVDSTDPQRRPQCIMTGSVVGGSVGSWPPGMAMAAVLTLGACRASGGGYIG